MIANPCTQKLGDTLYSERIILVIKGLILIKDSARSRQS
jgi:hypothetical protein